MQRRGERLMFVIREATPADAESLQELYAHHLTTHPPAEPQDLLRWAGLLADLAANPDYHLLLGEDDGTIVSSVTLVVIRNLTHNLRPYAVIENVVTHAGWRGRGFATALMHRAAALAKASSCYKIMLMTGSRRAETLQFYERCGYNHQDKTAFIQWMD
jgi:GNAT superfamily N-acetyltransferase